VNKAMQSSNETLPQKQNLMLVHTTYTEH